jgi:hypothetical protein
MCADTLTTDKKVKIAAPEEQPFIAALAWRISFTENATTDGLDTVVIKKPRNLTAILTPIDMQGAWEEGSKGDSLILVWAPPGVNRSFGVERELDAWMRGRAERYQRTLVQAGIRAVRVAWDGARAVICCAEDHLQDAIDAVLRFSVVEWEASNVERILASTWPIVEEDAPLAHSISRRQFRRQKGLDALTEWSVHLKTRYLRVSQSLEQLDPTLPEPSQRLYSELVLAARLYDRLELLEEPIQFMLDHCEIANTRLMDAKHALAARHDAWVGHVLELGIILTLLVQIYQAVPVRIDRALLAPASKETAEKTTAEKATAAPEAETSDAAAVAEKATSKAASSLGGVDPLTAEKRPADAADQKAKFLNSARRPAQKVGAVAPSKAASAWVAAKHVAAQAAGGNKLGTRPPRSRPSPGPLHRSSDRRGSSPLGHLSRSFAPPERLISAPASRPSEPVGGQVESNGWPFMLP